MDSTDDERWVLVTPDASGGNQLELTTHNQPRQVPNSSETRSRNTQDTTQNESTSDDNAHIKTSENRKEPKEPEFLLVRADILIPGLGPPIANAGLVYRPGHAIAWVGHILSLPPIYLHTKLSAHVRFLMPGLWDAHVHLTGSDKLPLDDLLLLNPYLAGARLGRDLAALLDAGYTSVRELGGHGWAVRQAVREGWLAGPNVYSSVSMLSTTGGHGDAHRFPLAAVHEQSERLNFFELCDGPAECVRAVRRKARQGADTIKVAASGGVLSLLDDPTHQQFSAEELKAVVEEARRHGMVVTAHCHGKPGIMAALAAGVRVIEHGTFIDEEAAAIMKRDDVMLVATRSISQFGVGHPEAMDPEIYAKMVRFNQQHRAAYAFAVKQGIKCALGTDRGVSSEKVNHRNGDNAIELVYAVQAGMSPAQALTAATANGPLTLGPERAPKSGVLKEGYDADFIALTKNPLEDVRVLLDKKNITHVWKTGKLYKKPGHPVGLLPLSE